MTMFRFPGGEDLAIGSRRLRVSISSTSSLIQTSAGFSSISSLSDLLYHFLYYLFVLWVSVRRLDFLIYDPTWFESP